MNTRFFSRIALTGIIAILCGCNTILDATVKEPINTDPSERSFGTWIDDTKLETIIEHNINLAHTDLKSAHVDVDSFNGVILLSGEVPREELKTLAGQAAKEVSSVRQVHNELTIRANSSTLSRLNDSYIHKKIKFNLSQESELSGVNIDVIVKDSVAYLMGLVNANQAEVAAHTTSLTGGVRKVVKVFEYLD